MQVLKKVFLAFLLFLGLCAFGIVVGYGAGYGFNVGLFNSWQKLDSGIKFTHIEEADSQRIWARANDGKLYLWGFNCHIDPNCGKWMAATEIPEDIHADGEKPIQRTNNCQSESMSPPRLPRNVTECVQAWFVGPEFGKIVYYALVNDGKIWAWQNNSSGFFDEVIPIFCAMGGFFLSFIFGIIFIVIWLLKIAFSH
jgi:hypothetical protein